MFKRKSIILIAVLLLACACIFLPMPKMEVAASIEGVSGNKFVLTGEAGTNPQHFFHDGTNNYADDNSTLVNAEAKNNGLKYYSIVSSKKGETSGWSQLVPTPDMVQFIENGLLYATASATISGENTPVNITIENGSNSKTVTSASGYIETEMLKIEDKNSIKYSFWAMVDGKQIVIDEPTIRLYTIINSITLNTTSQEVSPKQFVKIDAYNEVTSLVGAGNFMSISKIMHEINYEFTNGSNYVTKVGSSLYIKDNAPNGATITFRVYSQKDSSARSNIQYLYSNYITLTVNTSKVKIDVVTDFENPAKITNNHISLVPGRSVVLTETPNAGFEFVGWYIDNQFQHANRSLRVTATFGQQIYAKYIKTISVKEVIVPSKTYDGTTDIDQSTVAFSFDGVEAGHDVGISGATFKYTNANAGQKVIAATVNGLTLIGQDADIYKLKSQILPTINGEILKREAYIYPENAQKQYGDGDTEIKFSYQNVIEGESVAGSLSRQSGEAIGSYNITLGNLAQSNTNYNFKLIDNGSKFTIVQRQIWLSSVFVEDKVYDGTLSATIKATLTNVYNNEDVLVSIVGQFLTKDAGIDKQVNIVSATLYGKDKNNYILQSYTQTLYGNITPKPITVTAHACSTVYGEAPTLTFDADLCKGDSLTGELTLQDTSAGQQQILIGSLSGSNYTINFVSAICTVLPRKAYVVAEGDIKTYGEDDPTFKYSVTNLVNNDTLTGTIMRDEGEDVGSYTLNAGSLYNPNYEIVFTSNVLKITPRTIEVNIAFTNKQYDGTTAASYDVSFDNNINNENFALVLDAYLSTKDCGNAKATVNSASIAGDNKNYLFNFNLTNKDVLITPKDAYVFINNLTKIYGDEDPEFSYSATNLVDNESLNLVLTREIGNDVGKYNFIFDSYISLNPNYNIILAEPAFEILPRTIKVNIKTLSKTYGDPEPEIEFELAESLCYDDDFNSILTGKITRIGGEDVGLYEFDLSALSTSANYIFTLNGQVEFSISKRPVKVVCYDETKVYGQKDPVFRYDVIGDLENDKLEVNILRNYKEDVGEYELICGTTNDPRYIIEEFTSAKLTITPYEITIKADDKIKIYGDADPTLSVSIVSGILQNSDRLENIFCGNLQRAEGEDVNNYQITNLTDYPLGKNYIVNFIPGTLEIIKRNITITAKYSSKTYGDDDPIIGYDISPNGLAYDDVVSGRLSRTEGEDVSLYDIEMGNIYINDNYSITFVSNKFEILKKRIEVVPTNTTKQYGMPDGEIGYYLVDPLVKDDDVISGYLYRDTDGTNLEPTGKYRIHSNLSSPNYEIVLAESYYTIQPRVIVIRAESCQFTYGGEEPLLTYNIISGVILEGDTLTGGIKRKPGNNVGTYDIISSLNLGLNYDIKFEKGTVTILPLDITIQSENYTKAYGQGDPLFSYQIVSGQLINNDVLYGTLTREPGEDVGSYNIIKGVYNANYNITLNPAKLTIVPKDVYLVTQIVNKVYDGNTIANLKNPYVSGTIDDVYLSYQKDNCANFDTFVAGENIHVTLHDIVLVGDKANNYNLVLPTNLYASISFSSLNKEQVSVSASDPILFEDASLDVVNETVDKNVKIQNHSLAIKCSIQLSNTKEASVNNYYTVKVHLPKNVYGKNNIYVYLKMADGNFKLLSSEKTLDGEIVITTTTLGEFYITTEDESWMDYATTMSIIALTVIILAGSVWIIKKRRNKQLNNK